MGADDVADDAVLCDTTYVSQLMRAASRPGINDHWPADAVERLDSAILTISVITVAELRFGMIRAGWGLAKRAEAEHRLAAYTWIPLDAETIDRWAALQAEAMALGHTGPGHNDLWIAASALVRGYPLVSCDVAQCELPGVCDNVIYLPADPSSRALRV